MDLAVFEAEQLMQPAKQDAKNSLAIVVLCPEEANYRPV